MRLDAATGRQRGEPIRGWGWTGRCSRRQNGRDRPSREWRGVHRCARPALGPADCVLAGRRARMPCRHVTLQPRWEVAVRVGPSRATCSTGSDSYFAQIWDPGTGSRPVRSWRARPSAIYTPCGRSSGDAHEQPAGSYVMPPTAGSGARVSPADAGHCLARIRTVAPSLTAAADNTVRLWQISPEAEPVSGGGNRHAGIDDRRSATRPPDAGLPMSSGRVCGRMGGSPSRWPRVRRDEN